VTSGRARRAAAGILAAVGVGCALACGSQSDALARGQQYYEDNQYERALALWRELDRRGAEFGPAERARYAYLRGMTDYRLGYRDDARHWLAIARTTDGEHPGKLGTVWRERLDTALADLAQSGARAVGEGPDAIQTIEVSPGAALPGDTDDGSLFPVPEEPRGTAPAVVEPGFAGRSTGSASTFRAATARPGSDAGAPAVP